MRPAEKKSINDVQPLTVDDHFGVLLADETFIDGQMLNMTPDDLPDWYDDELFQTGKQYFITNRTGITFGGIVGLVSVLAIPSILKVLIYTKQSGTSCTAFRRYLQTILHVTSLYEGDSVKESSRWYKSLNVVRSKHCRASSRCLRDGVAGITQRDMAITQFGFIGYVLLKPKELGLTDTLEEREGFNHFWRVVGHMLGIPDRLNICRREAAETTELCRRLLTEVFGKHLKEVPPNFIGMTEVLLDGLWTLDPLLQKNGFMAFTYRLSDVPYDKPLGVYGWLNSQYLGMMIYMMNMPHIGPVARFSYNQYIRFSLWFVTRFPIRAWLRYGTSESKITLYPKLTSQ